MFVGEISVFYENQNFKITFFKLVLRDRKKIGGSNATLMKNPHEMRRFDVIWSFLLFLFVFIKTAKFEGHLAKNRVKTCKNIKMCWF